MKKTQKQTVYQFMKKSLRKEYFYLKRDLLLYCPIEYGEFSTNAYYAALDKDGISIYQYDKKVDNRIKLLERHPWKTWNRVKIDHFFKKSEFVFQGQSNRIFYFLNDGKAVQRIIEQYTTIEVEVATRSFWRKFPGFRSQSPINMYVAAIVYAIIPSFVLKLVLPYLVQKLLFSISVFTMLLGLLCLVIGLIDPTIVLWKQKEKTRKKVAYYFSYITIIGFICIFIFW
ncbi:hypothetical protein [Ectobacillus polymachus]|uniref:hypothetical protein n=1 Tax=Ectobacillus polymachus TaxID=1508806 RepID=UPI003A84B7D3